MSRDLFYERVLRPILFRLDPEMSHNLVYSLIPSALPLLGCLPLKYPGRDLRISFASMELDNPVGLAAGFDKNGRLLSVLSHLGFGFAEIGSVTGRASRGNPRPRLFRLPADEALINFMGLNGDGAESVAKRVKESRISLPVGINIAKTNDPSLKGDAAIEDILSSFKAVRDLPIKYLTFNASCPNTRQGCLQARRELSDILTELQKLNCHGLPVFLKVSPDSPDELLENIVAVASACSLSGYICGNTTVSRDGLRTERATVEKIGSGGLSGAPLRPLALRLCRKIYKLKTPAQSIIAAGGISSGQAAYDFLKAGASAVELYTGLVYRGPTLPRQINEELSALLRRDGQTLLQCIGSEHG